MASHGTELGRIVESLHTTCRKLADLHSRYINNVNIKDELKTPSGRRSPRLTPKQRAALKLQGEYMGTMRGLSIRMRNVVKSTRRLKGIRAAIAQARRLSKPRS